MTNHPRHRPHGPAWQSGHPRTRRVRGKAKGERSAKRTRKRTPAPRLVVPVMPRLFGRARRG